MLRGINPWRVDAADELRGLDPVLSGAVVGSIPGMWTRPASGIDPWRVEAAGELFGIDPVLSEVGGIDPVLRVGEEDDDGFKVQMALSICFRQFARVISSKSLKLWVVGKTFNVLY